MPRRLQMRTVGLERVDAERLRRRVWRLLAALHELADDAGAGPGAWSPPVDLCESADCVVVRVEMPGVEASEVELTLTNGALRIAGRKKRRAPRGVISHLCSERAYGAFSRTVPLRWPLRTRGASAQLENGLLTVRLPKLPDRRGAEFKIPIKGEE